MAALAGLATAVELWLGLALLVGGMAAICCVVLAPQLPFWLWLLTGPTVAGLFAVGGAGGGLAISADRACLALFTGIMALHLLRLPDRCPRPGRQEWLMGGFLLLTLLSMFISGGSSGYAEGSIKRDLVFWAMGYAFPFMGFYFAKHVVVDEERVQRLLLLFLMVAAYDACTGIVGYVLGVDWFFGSRYETVHPDRAHGPFANAVEFGLILNVGLVIATLLLLRCRDWLQGGVLVGLQFLFILALFLSKTRAVWLGVCICLLMVMYYRPVLRGPLLAMGSLAAVIGMAVVPVLVDLRVLLYRVTEMAPIYNRFTLAATSMDMISSNPLFGVGFGRDSFAKHKLPHMTTVGEVPMFYAVEMGVPHNEFIHILVMCGLVGLALYGWILLRGMLVCRALLREQDGLSPQVADLALVVLCAQVMFVFNGFFADLGPFTFAAIQLQVLTGACFGMIMRRHAELRDRWHV